MFNIISSIMSSIMSNTMSNIMSNIMSSIMSNRMNNAMSNIMSNILSNVMSNMMSNIMSNIMSNVYLAGTTSIVSNAFVVSFYLHKYDKVAPFLYILNSSCDIFTGIAAILHFVIFVFIHKESQNVLLSLITVSFSVTAVSMKVSVMLNLILSVTRTINIMVPFAKISRIGIATSVTTYFLFWIIFSSVQLTQAFQSQFSLNNFILNFFYQSTGSTSFLVGSKETLANTCTSTSIFIGIIFVLPAGICILCLVIQILSLLSDSRGVCRCRHGNGDNFVMNRRRMTVTIVLVTILFCVCSIGPIILIGYKCSLVGDVGLKSITGKGFDFDFLDRLEYVCSFVLPFANAAINPAILIQRGKNLKRSVRSRVSAVRQRLSLGGHP